MASNATGGPRLGIDYGTTNTVAMLSWTDGRARQLLFDGSPLLPSGVCLGAGGRLLTGRDAQRAARMTPQAYEPNPKRRVDEDDVLLGEQTVPTAALIAATLARVWHEAGRVGPALPREVVITCPVAWGPARQLVLLEAAAQAGLPAVTLVPEPIAAATYFAEVLGHDLPLDQSLIIYDLGAGTFDVSVVRRGQAGLAAMAYRGVDDFGGLDLDAVVVAIIGEAIEPAAAEQWQRLLNPRSPAEHRHARALWQDATEVKEALSNQSSAGTLVPLIDRDVVVTREQFEEAARHHLRRTIEVSLQCIREARIDPSETAGIFLVGGATRTPLVATMLHAATGIAPTTLDLPELVVAEGALRAAPPDPGPDAAQSREPVPADLVTLATEAPTARRPVFSRVRRVPPRAARVAVAVFVVLVGALYGVHRFGSQAVGASACTDPVRLTVAASPEIAGAVAATATEWTRSSGSAGGRCVTVEVAPVDSADIAGAVAGRAGITIAGVTNDRHTVVPDVWIPDSSLWLQRLGTAAVPAAAPSVAGSPVVAAMPGPVAAGLGFPGKPVTWSDLIQRMTTGTGLRAGIVEPTRDAAGLIGLIALSAAAQRVGGADPQQLTGAILRGLVAGRSTVRDDLYRRFPRGPDPAALAAGIAAAPLSEQAVLAYNAKEPAVPLAAVPVQPPATALDFPFAVLAGTDAEHRQAAERLRAALRGPAFTDRLAAAGLRTADGSTGRNFSGSPSSPPPGGETPQRAVVDRLLASWTAMSSPARLLTLLDVSGSMLRPVPTAANATRMQVTLEAAKRGLALFDDSWSSGLWIFSTELDGPTDYRQVVPIEPVGSNRQAMLDALSTVRPKPNGDTGMYDSILAAYRHLKAGWTSGMVNTLIVFTDGENDDANGLSREQLLAELNREKDPQRPIRVVLIAIGPDVAPENLRPITDVAGGGVFAAPDPAKIGDIFFQVITSRT